MDRVVKCTVMLEDMREWDRMNVVYASYFPKDKPARSAWALAGWRLAHGSRSSVGCWSVTNARFLALWLLCLVRLPERFAGQARADSLAASACPGSGRARSAAMRCGERLARSTPRRRSCAARHTDSGACLTLSSSGHGDRPGRHAGTRSRRDATRSLGSRPINRHARYVDHSCGDHGSCLQDDRWRRRGKQRTGAAARARAHLRRAWRGQLRGHGRQSAGRFIRYRLEPGALA